MFSSYDLSAFSKRLKEIRKSLGFTQEDVVQGTGLSSETLRKIENGFTIPRYDTIELLSLFYKIDLHSVMNQYKGSRDLLHFYEMVDFHIVGFDVDSIYETIQSFQEYMKTADPQLINKKELEQLNLFFKGLSVSYEDNLNPEKQIAAIELYEKALRTCNPNFTLDAWWKYKYSYIELRILYSIASLSGFLRNTEISNNILEYLLDTLDMSNASKYYDKLLIIKVLATLVYNHHRSSNYELVLKLSQLGIDYCNQNAIMAYLALLLFRKGVAMYYLEMEGHEQYLDDSITLLRIQGLNESVEDYTKNAIRYRKPLNAE